MNEKLDINLKSLEVKGEGEITLRVGEALKPLPPKKLEITGNIDSVTRFLKKRGFDNCEQIWIL